MSRPDPVALVVWAAIVALGLLVWGLAGYGLDRIITG